MKVHLTCALTQLFTTCSNDNNSTTDNKQNPLNFSDNLSHVSRPV